MTSMLATYHDQFSVFLLMVSIMYYNWSLLLRSWAFHIQIQQHHTFFFPYPMDSFSLTPPLLLKLLITENPRDPSLYLSLLSTCISFPGDFIQGHHYMLTNFNFFQRLPTLDSRLIQATTYPMSLCPYQIDILNPHAWSGIPDLSHPQTCSLHLSQLGWSQLCSSSCSGQKPEIHLRFFPFLYSVHPLY